MVANAHIQHIVLVNGPPRSGKDTFAALLADEVMCASHITKFAKRLKEMTHALYGLILDGKPLKHDYYESSKDEPHDHFMGVTPRNAYIAVSEDLLKKLHGPSIFGRLVLQELESVTSPLVVVTDSGFIEEARVLVDVYGKKVVIAQMHRQKHGFTGDSRGYVSLPGVKVVKVHNDGDLGSLRCLARDFARLVGLRGNHGDKQGLQRGDSR